MDGVAMSVINQMLQDLENRHSASSADTSLSAQIKAVAKRRRLYPVWWVTLLFALVFLAGLLAWWLWPVSKAGVAMPADGRRSDVSVMQTKPPVTAELAQLPPRAVPERSEQHETDSGPVVQMDAAPQPAAAQVSEIKPGQLPAQQAVLSLKPAVNLDFGKQQPTQVGASLPRLNAGSGERAAAATMATGKQIKEITPQQQAENDYGKAVSLLQQGRAAEASELLGKVLQLDPVNTSARQTLAGLLVDGKRYDEAQRSLQDGLKLDPSQTGLAMILARLQVEQGDTQSALKSLQRSLPYAVERPDYQAFMAALLQREGRHKEAIEHYLQALRKSPGSGVWLMGLGISLQAENRLAEAQEAFNRAKASHTLSPELQAFVDQQLKQSGKQ
jgi:MSHA biogenesis protein MshN